MILSKGDLKKEFPLPYKVQKIKKQRDQEIEDIFTGKVIV